MIHTELKSHFHYRSWQLGCNIAPQYHTPDHTPELHRKNSCTNHPQRYHTPYPRVIDSSTRPMTAWRLQCSVQRGRAPSLTQSRRRWSPVLAFQRGRGSTRTPSGAHCAPPPWLRGYPLRPPIPTPLGSDAGGQGRIELKHSTGNKAVF